MYTEWNTIDETQAADAYSTVCHAAEPPPVDWPNMLGYQPTDEEDHWLVVWVFTDMGHELELLSNKAFRCPDPNCDARVTFTSEECFNCRWEVPESFRTVPITIDWRLYMLDQAFMTTHVPVTSQLDMLDAARWAGKGDHNAAMDLLLDHIARYDTDPFTLATFYGPVQRVVGQQGRMEDSLTQIKHLTLYSTSDLMEKVQNIVELAHEDSQTAHYGVELCRVLGKLALKYVHDLAHNEVDIAMFNVPDEVMCKARIHYSELSMGEKIQSAWQDGVFYRFSFDKPAGPVRGAVAVTPTSELLMEVEDIIETIAFKDTEQQHMGLARMTAKLLESNSELHWMYTVADTDHGLLAQVMEGAHNLLVS